jgi:hypothetical protein
MAVTTPEQSGTRPKFRVQNENGVTGGKPQATGVRQSQAKPQRTSQPRLDNMPRPRMLAEGIADPQVPLEDLEQDVMVEDHLDFQADLIEDHVQSIADQLGYSVETVQQMLAENEEGVGQLLYQQGIEYAHDNLGRAHDGDFDSRYDDELVKLGKDGRALRTVGKAPDEAMKLLRETVAQNQSPLMFAPLWPPADKEGFQPPPTLVLKTSIPVRLRGKTSTGKKWSLRPPVGARFRPKPTIHCDLACDKWVWTRKELLLHYRVRHKDEWESAKQERELELAEAKERREAVKDEEQMSLLRRQNAIAELQLQTMLSRGEVTDEARERLLGLGLLTVAQEREMQEAEAGG